MKEIYNIESNILGKTSEKSMFWYEDNPVLLKKEIDNMSRFFPNFKLSELKDGRLCWTGTVNPTILREDAVYVLQAVYDHNYPANNTYGGSIKVYVVDPDLQSLSDSIEEVPHLIKDQFDNIFICTCRQEDFVAGAESSSVVAAIAWAVKWLYSFELWLSGDIETEEFDRHF